ncbi:MAG: right-handed parallel beta-helix repeat-containing protein [Armatimonadota bacterium]|jgi:hypothetical protein
MRMTMMTLMACACSIAAMAACLAAEYHVAQKHPQAADDNPGTAQRPWKTISHAAEVMQPGDTAIVHEGLYREYVQPQRSGTQAAPITYRAGQDEDVIITGADIIDGWERDAGGDPVWKKSPWTLKRPTHPNNEQHRLIGRCEQVIVRGPAAGPHGELLQQVLTRAEMSAGTFCADTEGQVLYVWLAGGDDPAKHTIEASVRNRCFGLQWGREGLDYIHVEGFTMRYAANMAQRGALYCRGNHWLIADNVIEWVNGNGLSFRGTGHVLRENVCQYNGQMGMGGGGRDWLMENNSLLHNNQKGYSTGWEAGGIKITHTRGGKVIGMRADGNNGPGIWLDIDVRDVLIDRCSAKDNTGSGIHVEISGDVAITNCLLAGNGGGREGNWAHGGIQLSESDNCRVEHNICVANRTGIAVRMQGPRTFKDIDGNEVSYHTKGHVIRRNIAADNVMYQFGLWGDNVFFGPHPSASVGMRGTPLNPDELDLTIDENLYHPHADQGLVLWGCPWRAKHKKYPDLAEFVREHKQDARSLVTDPLFVDAAKGDFRLRRGSPAIKPGIGLQRVPVGMDEVVAGT